MARDIRLPILLFLTLLVATTALADDIFQAARRGDAFTVKHYLRKSPESLDATDGFLYTPLDWAAIWGRWEVVELLVEAGARVDNVGFDGGTVMHRACHHDRPDMVRLLLDRGAGIDDANQWGRTPLHVAARRGCDLTAALLLDRGADPDAVTKEGWTPLHVAYKAGHPPVAEVLEKRGADPERRDAEGKLPADHAMKRPESFELQPDALEEYAGRYALGPHVEARVWMEEGRLHLAEFSPDRIYPIGPDRFFCVREPWTVRFTRDDAGTVAGIEIDFLRRTVKGPRVPELTYVGSKICASCHLGAETGGQQVAWMRSAHGRAYWELKTDWARFLASIRDEYRDIEDPSSEWKCLKCHVTGAQDFDAVFAEDFDDTEGVGCEACHGPGSAYIDPEIMADRELFLKNGGRVPEEGTCRTCHEDDRFHFDERLPKIAHPRPDKGAAEGES